MFAIHKNRSFAVYVCCGALVNLWIQSSNLASTFHPLYGYGADVVVADRTYQTYIWVGGAAFLLVGLLCDKIITSDCNRRRLSIALAAAALLPSTWRLLDVSFPVYFTLTALATLLGYGAYAVVMGSLFRGVSYALKPLAYGLAFSAGVLLRFPIDWYNRDGGTWAHGAYLLAGSAALLLYCLLASSRPARVAFESPEAGEAPRPADRKKMETHLLLMAAVCSMSVYLLFGVYDNLVTNTPVVNNYILYVRLLQAIVPGLAGLVCIRWGHYTAIMVSVFFLGVGSLANIFSYSGIAGLVFSLAYMTGINFFLGPMRALFAELGQRWKVPYTVTGLGFALYYFTTGLGPFLKRLMQTLGQTGGMVLYLMLFMLSIPVIMVFFHMLRTAHTAAPSARPAASASEKSRLEALGLTRREREIFELVLQGKLSREIAETLFVSESTVNWHVGNILKKTGLESRSKLVEQYRE